MSRSYRLTLALLVLGPLTPLWAGDWPAFRGPRQDGRSDGADLVTTWSDTEHLVWKTPLPGPGSSSPIVVGDRVYVTCYSGYGVDRKAPGDPNALRRHLLGLDLSSGRILWTRTIGPLAPEDPWRGRFQEHGYASATPAATSERVVAFFGKSGVRAYSPAGHELWQRSVGTGSDRLHWGSAASPTFSAERVLVNAWDESQRLVALNAADGTVAWSVDLAGTGLTFATPVTATVPDGRREIILVLPEQVWGLDPATGQRLWTLRTVMKGSIMGTPVVHDDIVYVHGGGPSGHASVAVRCGGRGDVTETHRLWTCDTAASVPSPVYHDGALYWVNNDGEAFRQDAATGAVTHRAKLPVSGRFAVYASAVLAGGRLYVVTRHEGTFVLSADDHLRVLAQNRFASDPSDFSASPAVSGDRLLLRSHHALYCLRRSP